MAVQNSADNTNRPIILSGESYVLQAAIAQNAQRTTPILPNTVMAKLAGQGREWVPWNSVAGVDGSAVPRGIYLGESIAAADLVAGVVDGCAILAGGCCTVDEDLVVFDDSTLSVDSVVGNGTIWEATCRELLYNVGIFLEGTIAISEYEN